MLQLAALALGLCAWITLMSAIAGRKRHTKEQTQFMRFLAWCFCAAALYLPTLAQFLAFRAGDHSEVIDCASAYHLCCAALLAVQMLLTVISLVMKTKEPPQRGSDKTKNEAQEREADE